MGLASILFSFSGRVNRRVGWAYGLLQGAVGLAVLYVIYLQLMATPLPPEMTPDQLAEQMKGLNWLNLVNLAFLWPSLAIGVKRCHDRGRSGWFLLLLVVPLLNLWPIVELAFLRGDTGDNRFGPDPLEGHAGDSWKSWAIFVGYILVFTVQGNLGLKLIMVMKDHMPAMQRPGGEMPAPTTPNPVGLRPTAT